MTTAEVPGVGLVVDLSTLRAYAAGSVHAGEPLQEVADDGALFAVPIVAAYEALAGTSGKELARLYRLFALDACALQSALPEDLVELTYWRRITGRADLAAAAHAAVLCDAPILTGDGARYDGRVPIIHMPPA